MVSSGLRRLAAALRAELIAILVLLPATAGCAGPSTPPPDGPRTLLFALDGRWPFDADRAEELLSRAGLAAPEGALVMGEAMGARAVADFAALDDAAAAKLHVQNVARGQALVARAWAEREGLAAGDALELRSHAYPDPYVATYFEMERTQPCERRPEAKLCFLPALLTGEARLRLRVDRGARDAAFLPDLVELGPKALPAWWNGTFTGPTGEKRDFSAHAALEGALVPAEFEGAMEAGEWTITFRLETRHGLAPAGAAGIVRVREPGYLWFDDRLQRHADAAAQARAVLANATPTRTGVRVAGLADELPLGADIILSLDDARALVGTQGVTALLVNMSVAHERAFDAASRTDGTTLALRARALAGGSEGARETGGDLVFAAPASLDVSLLPRVAGGGSPSLALAGRAPLGEDPVLDGADAGPDVLLLAHADGPVPWTLPAGGRWTDARDALENLSRSRTLALASADLLAAPIATARVEIGAGNTTRALVAIGGVVGGPNEALWTSAALVAGAGRPVNARIVLPLEPGAERADVAQRALEAWGPLGAVLDR